jgi:PIN domain nuclease of toxin-antitoxin system
MDIGAPMLGKTSRRLIQEAWDEGNLAVSAITFWECALLQQRQRIVLPVPARAWRTDLIASGLLECPLDGEIAVLGSELDLPHKDPADRFLAATAIARAATLVTADDRLLAWKHPLKRQDARR